MTAAPTVFEEGHEPTHAVRMNRMGLWLFFLSDSLVFALLLASRFYLAGVHTPPDVKQILGLGMTSILLFSSLTAYRAETAIVHGNTERGRRMLLVTALLGAIFLGGVGMEWGLAEFAASEAYGTAFFSMTGMHAAHVASGVLMLLLARRQATVGAYAGGGHRAWGASGIVMYWHFVDVVWVFFYPALYLIH